MAVLHTNRKEVVTVTQPGAYRFEGAGLQLVDAKANMNMNAPRLLVVAIGDFVSSSSTTNCRINGRPPLGALQRLADGDVIDIDDSLTGPVEPDATSETNRFEYFRRGPAIRCRGSVEVRCAYSNVLTRNFCRCSNCFQLYDEEIWLTELSRTCPACFCSDGEDRSES